MNTREIGRQAEDLVCKLLIKKGYKIICRNWTCYAGEIDIIVQKERLVFIEVKSVGASAYCKPHELFTPKKRKSLLRAIQFYLSKNHLCGVDWRLTLVCLEKGKNEKKFSGIRVFSQPFSF